MNATNPSVIPAKRISTYEPSHPRELMSLQPSNYSWQKIVETMSKFIFYINRKMCINIGS